jgi:type IV secretion system protein VirD4
MTARRTRPRHRPRPANDSPWGRLCPPMLACLDELPSTAPLPTLRTRMANERALGISFIWAAQTWRPARRDLRRAGSPRPVRPDQRADHVRRLQDVAFNQEISDLVGTVRVARTTWQTGQRAAAPITGRTSPSCRAEEVRQLPERTPSSSPRTAPIIAKLTAASTASRRRHLAQPRVRLGHRRPFIPACWPKHPHLVHDLAVLADQRRRAGRATPATPSRTGTATPCPPSTNG